MEGNLYSRKKASPYSYDAVLVMTSGILRPRWYRLKGQWGGYFDRLVPSHWLCPVMPPLAAFGPLAAPVGPLRCFRPPLALARVTHMHSAAPPRHSGAPGGLQRALRPCLSCHCRSFVGAHNCEKKHGARIIQGARFHPGPQLRVQRPKGG